MSKFILLGFMLVILAALSSTLALKLPKSAAAAHHSAAPFDPLHSALQRGGDEMALP
jgi:hypothetical protein